MRRRLLCLLTVAALAAPAFAHGGGYVTPPSGGGPPATPGFGDAPGPSTKWETWWCDNREDLLRIAEHVDALKAGAVTPSAGSSSEPNPAKTRATFAAAVREDILPCLLAALGDRDFDVRASAAIALGKLGDERGALPLQSVSRCDARVEVRHAALIGLGLLGRRDELPFLCDVVNDRQRDVDERALAALSVGLLGGDDAANFLAYFIARDATKPDPRLVGDFHFLGTIYEALGLTESVEALRPLWCAADDDRLDPFLRAHAVVALGRLRDRESLDRLVKLVGPNTDIQLRRCAVLALGRVANSTDASAVKALKTVLETERDAVMRRFAITGLGRLRLPSLKSLLRGRFAVPGDPDRAFLALGLALQGDLMSAPAIRKALDTEHDESAKSAYCTALGILKDVDSVPILEAQIGPGPMPGTYRGFAAMALAVLPSVESREILWKRLPAEHDARVWGDFAVALGLLGDPRVRGFLGEQLKKGDGNFEKCRAASCLGVLRRADAVKDLVEIAGNQIVDGVVRALCIVALGQIGDPSPVPKLSRLSAGGDSTLATRALAEALSIL